MPIDPVTISARLEAATEKAENASDILKQVAHGDETVVVETESGGLPSLAKWYADLNAETGDPRQIGDRLDGLETATLETDQRADALEQFQADALDQTDAAKGSHKFGHKRAPLADAIKTVGQFLDAQPVSVWEFANLITEKPTPSDPSTWDWTPAIQAAFNAAEPTSGVVRLPLLNPIRHTTLTLRQGVSIEGYGLGSWLRNIGTGNAFEWEGDTTNDTSPRKSYQNSQARLQSVNLRNFVSEGSPTSLDGFHLRYTERYGRGGPKLDNVVTRNHGRDGIYWEFGDNLQLDNVSSLYNGRHGLHVFQNTNQVNVRGGCYSANAQRGIYLNQVASTSLISGAAIHDNGTNAIFCQRTEQPLIYFNAFNGNGHSTTQDHAVVAFNGDGTKVVESAVVESCLFGGNITNGPDIETSFVKSALFQSNYIFNVSTTKPYIFRLGGESRGVVIRGTRWNITAGSPLKISVAAGQEANVDYILEDDEAQNSATGMPDSTKRVDVLWNQFLEYRPRNANNVLFQTRVTGAEAAPLFLITGRGAMQWRRDGDTANPLRSLSINASDQLEFAGRVKTDLGFITNGAAHTDRPIQLGAYYLWVDSAGRLRIKNGTPTSDTDGTVVGAQA